ncbi:MAG: 4Fe-4S dicluster domain-containing protein [Vulcanibacillus sp.]
MNEQNHSVINISVCRGCSHANYQGDELVNKIQKAVDDSALEKTIKDYTKTGFLSHHPFQITIARCPNSCSRPQLADISIVAMNKPVLTDNYCIMCAKCVRECKENSIVLGDIKPIINYDSCINCGDCIRVCPSGTISTLGTEFQFSVGGRLGRHPRFAMEMGKTESVEKIVEWAKKTMQFYIDNIKGEERFSVVLDRYGINNYQQNILGIR